MNTSSELGNELREILLASDKDNCQHGAGSSNKAERSLTLKVDSVLGPVFWVLRPEFVT
jgi:hypothetical protein